MKWSDWQSAESHPTKKKRYLLSVAQALYTLTGEEDDLEITDEYIAETLNSAITSDDVKELIQKLEECGRFRWDHFGRMEMNVNVAEAAELTPIETLCEKITNQIDALIEWKINECGRTELESPRQAIAAFYPEIPEGRLRNLSTGISGVSDMEYYDCEIRLVESGVKDKPTIIFADRGCGNAASDADKRILSLNQGNKNKKLYFMGAFGRGGSTCLRHCGNGLSMVMSRPRNHPESNLVCWTIIRKVGGALSDFKTSERAKTGYYQMLVNNDGSIPTIPAGVFKSQYSKCPRRRLVAPSLANVSESDLNCITKGAASYDGEYGTFIKLFEFDFNVTPRGDDSLRAMASQSMTRAGWGCMNAYLFDLPYPIAITDSRDVQKNDIYRYENGKGRLVGPRTEKFPDSRMIYGNVRRLGIQRQKNKIKDFYEVERKIIYKNSEHGSITIRLWFFIGESRPDSVKIGSYIETIKSKTRIFLTLNGQTIFRKSKDWHGFEELDLYYIPYYTLIQVELDNLSDDFKTDLFDSARKIFGSKMASIIFDELKDVIKDCPNLQDYENYYEEIQKRKLSREKNTKLERQLRRLIAEPGLQIFNPKAKLRTLRWKTRRTTKYNWIERDPPTWIDPFPAGEVEIPVGEEKKIRLRHNGPARLFSRKIRCGKVEMEWAASKGFLVSTSGSTITVTAPPTLMANEEDIAIIHPMVGRKKYPEHRILFRAIPSSYEAADPPTKFEIVRIREPIRIWPGATFKISISTDVCNDIFQRPDSNWKLKWEVTHEEPNVNTKDKVREKSRESPRNGRMGLYFVVDKNIPIGSRFVLSVQLVNEENASLSLPKDSIECEIIMIERVKKKPKDWYERRKRVSSGKGVAIRDVYANSWGEPPYGDWNEDTPGMIGPGWKRARDVEFHINCDCDPYKRAVNSKDKKWKRGKEKDNLYRLLLCSYLWDYENRKHGLENNGSVISDPAFKESEKISARSIVEMIMLAVEQL